MYTFTVGNFQEVKSYCCSNHIVTPKQDPTLEPDDTSPLQTKKSVASDNICPISLILQTSLT